MNATMTGGTKKKDSNNKSTAPTEILDERTKHTWIFEPETSDQNTKSLTEAGVEAIANHKYKPGRYTYLDNLLNPIWTGLAELLPLWLAPNMVTLLGAMHCAFSYAVTWYYSPNLSTPLPDWVIFLSGYCTIAYFTFDCMDGKQARRTGQSSPLGQLFDHGFDCICNLAHISTHAGYLQVGGSTWFFIFQGLLFYTFFVAQWEEYHTGELPHAMGNFGVTEINYGMGLLSIWNAFIDREKFWTTLLKDFLPESLLSNLPASIPQSLFIIEIRYFMGSVWLIISIYWILRSIYRVLSHDFVKSNDLYFSAISKLFTPFLIIIAPFGLPTRVIENETRCLSLCGGILISFLTMKMICFSMAKQSYAAIQMEAFPYWAVILFICSDFINKAIFTNQITNVLLSLLCIWNAYRLVKWAKIAIEQICHRLDINCFTIKDRRKLK